MMPLARLFEREPPAWAHLPSGPMSLLDMINFSLHGFIVALNLLSQEIGLAAQRGTQDPDATVSDADRDRAVSNLNFIVDTCRRLMLGAAEHRLARTSLALTSSNRRTYGELALELNTLRQAIEDDLRTEYFYHYPRAKALMVIQNGGWIPAMDAFPSARPEIEEGLDCYALGHHTAAVFHMMRAVEFGLRALARERRVKLRKKLPIEWADWQAVIIGIKKEADKIAARPRGPARDAALEFYRGALAEFEGFKDAYRNNVMHARRSYNEHEALGVITHVRSFMERLSARLDETSTKQIKWGLR